MGCMVDDLHPRHVEKPLREFLEVFPAVLISGPRQCGKTTLAKMVGIPRGYRHYDLHDKDVLEYAERDPRGFIKALPERAILDEIQLAPDRLIGHPQAGNRRRPDMRAFHSDRVIQSVAIHKNANRSYWPDGYLAASSTVPSRVVANLSALA